MKKRKYIPPEKRKTLSVVEAAELMGIGASLAYELIAADCFPVPPIKLGAADGKRARRVLIPRAALERFLDEGIAPLVQTGGAK